MQYQNDSYLCTNKRYKKEDSSVTLWMMLTNSFANVFSVRQKNIATKVLKIQHWKYND